MNNSELKKLIEKYLNGAATHDEKSRLFDFYDRMQTHEEWHAALMGDKDETKERIFEKINFRIGEEDGRPAFGMWKIAVTIAIIVSAGLLGLYYYSAGVGKTAHQQMLVATTKIIKIRLEDGTQVWLNKGSRLSYPSKFGTQAREVNLEGEAFFDVMHQSKPFVIRSGKMVTQVLGTSFNVQAYAANKVQKVSVVSGKVGVILPGAAKKQVVFLTRNQEIAFNKQSNVVNKTTITDARMAISWISNKIKFRNTPLPEAMQELERIYHVRITFASGLKACPVFADFSRTDSISKVLEMLAKSLGGKLVQKDHQTFYITGRPC